MEGTEGDSSARASKYVLESGPLRNEDILICVDVDPESLVEMKATGSNGRPLTRLDSIKQAVLLFVHAKLTINPEHRFAFVTLGKSASWVTSVFPSCFLITNAVKVAKKFLFVLTPVFTYFRPIPVLGTPRKWKIEENKDEEGHTSSML